jgi:hypothetical protein
MSPAPPDRENLLAGPHNARLGTAIHAFNIPAEPHLCLGSTQVCEAACYAKAFLFALQRERHRRNYQRSLQADFPNLMIAEIRRGMIGVIRIHTSGDFYEANYVRRWTEVARACPGTKFFAYTRSWRHAEVLAELIELARQPNVHLWFSQDRETGPSPTVARVRRAYLLPVDESEANVPEKVDLVFRVPLPRRPGQPTAYARPAKRANGALICPKEQGITRQVEMTCSRCRICFTDRGTRPATP